MSPQAGWAGERKPPSCRYRGLPRETSVDDGWDADEASRRPRLCSRLWWRLSQLGPPRCDLGSPSSRTLLRALPAPEPGPSRGPRMFIQRAGDVAGPSRAAPAAGLPTLPRAHRKPWPRAPHRPFTHPQWRSSFSPAGRHCRRTLGPSRHQPR